MPLLEEGAMLLTACARIAMVGERRSVEARGATVDSVEVAELECFPHFSSHQAGRP